jgi:hypothetical protein
MISRGRPGELRWIELVADAEFRRDSEMKSSPKPKPTRVLISFATFYLILKHSLHQPFAVIMTHNKHYV